MSNGYAQVSGDDVHIDLGEREGEELHEGQQPVTIVEATPVEDEGDSAVVPEAVVYNDDEPEPADAITVKIKTSDDKNHDIRISEQNTIQGLKLILEPLTDLPSSRMRLICLGRMLVDGKTLKESNVKDGVFVHLVAKPEESRMQRSQSSASNEGMEDYDLPTHLATMFSARQAEEGGTERTSRRTGRRNGLTMEDDYELSIWRYRVRALSMLMLFYYFMTLIAKISLMLNPREDEHRHSGQFKQVKSDIPLAVVDTMENLVGVAVALAGLKAAVSDAPPLARKFFVDLLILSVLHFINLFFWIGALYNGEIEQISRPTAHHHEPTPEQKAETLRSITSAMMIVHPLIWMTMTSFAFQYYKLLKYRHQILHPQPANGNDDGLDPMEGVV